MNLENAPSSATSINSDTKENKITITQPEELAFGLLMNRTLGGSDSRRPSDKSANDVQVEIILGQAQNLVAQSLHLGG